MSITPLNASCSINESSYEDNPLDLELQIIDSLRVYLIEDIYKRCFQTLQDNLNDHSYFALHGQAISVMVFNDLIKQLEILKHPENDYSDFEFFRIPSQETYKSVKTFFDTHPFVEEAECPYDHYYSDELLSVDFCLANQEPEESAFHFFSTNTNIMLETEFDDEEISNVEQMDIAEHPKMIDIAEKLFQSYSVQGQKRPLYLKQIMKLVKDVENNNLLKDENGLAYPGVGNLYLLILPKNILDEDQGCGYLCMEGGIQYDSENAKLSKEQLLYGLQRQDPTILEMFSGEDCTFFPQGRLICSSLSKDRDIKIFKFNALSDDFKIGYLEEIKNLARDIFNHSNFLKLKISRSYYKTSIN